MVGPRDGGDLGLADEEIGLISLAGSPSAGGAWAGAVTALSSGAGGRTWKPRGRSTLKLTRACCLLAWLVVLAVLLGVFSIVTSRRTPAEEVEERPAPLVSSVEHVDELPPRDAGSPARSRFTYAPNLPRHPPVEEWPSDRPADVLKSGDAIDPDWPVRYRRLAAC